MPRPAMWRDVSKVSKAGLATVEFRLRLPKGDVVLTQLPSVPFDPTLKTSDLWSVKAFFLNLPDTPFKASGPEKAQKQAMSILLDHVEKLEATIKACSETLKRGKAAAS